MLIGITGGIGSGKSTICRALAAAGYPVYDTDREAKRIIVEDEQVRQKMVALFGPDIYDEDVYFTDRVAAQVFIDPEKLAALNAIVHPAVVADVRRWANTTPFPLGMEDRPEWSVRRDKGTGERGLFVESAILYSSGLAELCDKVVWVDAPEEVRIARTMKRDGTDINKVRARIRAQRDDRDRADLVINNDGNTNIKDIILWILKNCKN